MKCITYPQLMQRWPKTDHYCVGEQQVNNGLGMFLSCSVDHLSLAKRRGRMRHWLLFELVRGGFSIVLVGVMERIRLY